MKREDRNFIVCVVVGFSIVVALVFLGPLSFLAVP
jgi:hypothetical protein